MNIVLITLIIYLVLMFGVAWYFSRKESIESYLINSKRTGLWFLTIAIVASTIGAGATIGIVSETYNSGISYGLAIPISLFFGAIILAIVSKKIKEEGEKYGAYTFVDFFEKRFDTKNKILVYFLMIFMLLIVGGVQAIAMASLASVLIGIDFTFALFVAAGITILYTAIGGLKIDFITDFIQFFVIVIMFLVMLFIGYNDVGGFNSLLNQVPEGHLNPFAFGGIVWFFGVIFLSGLIYLGDPVVWQRTVSAKSKKVARNSYILALPIFILFGLVILFFGLLASVKLSGIEQDTALFSLMEVLLPPSLLGIGFAAILAIIMSSVDSILIAGSTIIHRGIFKGDIKDGREVLYARLITALFGIACFSIAFAYPKLVSLSLFSAYLSVTFAIPLLFGLYSRKLSANAAFYSLLIGMISLMIAFPLVGENAFIFPVVISLVILISYDKIFKKKSVTPLEMIGFEE